MTNVWVLALSVLVGVSQGHDPRVYRGYQVIGVTPKTLEHVHKLHDISVKDVELDFWVDASRPNQEAQIMVPPHRYKSVVEELVNLGMEQNTLIDDVESLVSEEKQSLQRRKRRSAGFDYDNFHNYDEIMAEMDVLASKCKSGIKCEVYDIGKSYEGRKQQMLKVSIDEPNRRAYWMGSQIHAREWLAVATNLKIANHIITNYGSDEEATRLMDDGDWYFLFVHNPDGYVYTWTTTRLWRKNRFPTSALTNKTDEQCMHGIDLNRNYETRWGNVGTSDDPCSNVYKGEAAADQIEVQNVQKEILRLAAKLKAFVTIHTAARLILCPWGSVSNPTANPDEFLCDFMDEPDKSHVEGVAKLMAKNIEEYFKYSTWKGGNSCDTIYPAAGLTQDYAYGAGNIKYSFTPELRNEDANNTVYGFVPPASEINPSFLEMWRGFVTMVDAINDNEKTSGGNSLTYQSFAGSLAFLSLLLTRLSL